MMPFARAAALFLLTLSLAAGAAAAPASHAHRLTLDDAQRQRVLQAVEPRDTMDKPDKLPAGFQPTVGAKIPSKKKLPIHPLPQALVRKLPALKKYYYAKLPHKVLLIDPMQRKIIAVLAY